MEDTPYEERLGGSYVSEKDGSLRKVAGTVAAEWPEPLTDAQAEPETPAGVPAGQPPAGEPEAGTPPAAPPEQPAGEPAAEPARHALAEPSEKTKSRKGR